MTSISWSDDAGYVCFSAVGHAGADGDTSKEGAVVCAMLSITIQTLWTITNAEGVWKGPQGGEVKLRIPAATARNRGSLLSAFVALFALVQNYPSRVEMVNTSVHMKQLYEEWEQWLPPRSQRTSPSW